MNKNTKLAVWLPVIIATSIALGIFIGNLYITPKSDSRNYNSLNKINSILDVINKQYVDTVDMNKLIEETIPKIFNELDPHSVYIPAKDLEAVNEDLEGSFSGIGIEFNMLTDTIAVVNVVSGGPSEKAGVLPGDRIITINDTVYVGKENQVKIMKHLRGAKDSQVKVGIQRGNNKELIHFDITRGDVSVKSITATFIVDPGIGYIKVTKFGRTTYQEFITSIAKLKEEGAKAFIVDLRGNTGGYMDAAINMINEFMKEGQLIVYTQGKAFPRSDMLANGTGTCQEAPLVVLTDEWSGSASEIFAGAIQDNDRGMIVGRRTFGKGLVQSPVELSDGSAIRLTIARYYTPSGRSIQKKYELGEGDEYEKDLINRFTHGEFDSADSIQMNDSLLYKTSIGRPVYGGGGVMPDYFVPRDTVGMTSYYTSVMNNGLVYQFAFNYADHNREKLTSFATYKELYAYLKTQPLLNDFTTYAATKGIKKRTTLINISRNLITNLIQAYVVRNLFDDNGFYPILLEDDPTVNKAVELIKSEKCIPQPPVVSVASESEEKPFIIKPDKLDMKTIVE